MLSLDTSGPGKMCKSRPMSESLCALDVYIDMYILIYQRRVERDGIGRGRTRRRKSREGKVARV